MRVAIMIEGQEGVTWPQWVALAKAADEEKLDGLFRSDHYTMIHGLPGGALDAWTTIAALAPLTRNLRFGTLVSPVGFRHPSQLARVVASADHISGGRVELGIGTGWFEGEHRQNGFPFPPLGARTAELAEQVEIIVRSWREDTLDYRGAHYALDGQQALPKPVQQPHPPLLLGGGGGPRSLALAARYAAEYNTPAQTDPSESAMHRARLDAACAQIGRDPKSLTQSIMVVAMLGETDADAEARAARAISAPSGKSPLVFARKKPPAFRACSCRISTSTTAAPSAFLAIFRAPWPSARGAAFPGRSRSVRSAGNAGRRLPPPSRRESADRTDSARPARRRRFPAASPRARRREWARCPVPAPAATCAVVAACARAIAATLSTKATLRARLSFWNRGTMRARWSPLAAISDSERIFPVSSPRPSGLYGTRPIPSARQVARMSVSTPRVNSEYSDCSAAMGCSAAARRKVWLLVSDRPI
jgi:F420-dependent oxidoreductase-like protein